MNGTPVRRTRLVGTLLAMLIVGGACGRGVGSQPEAVALTFANANHGHQFLQPFADAVARETDGTVTIHFEDEVRAGEVDVESILIDDVTEGTYDLGWVAPRPWHDRGVTAFDALIAPFLIDSHAVQAAVLESEIPNEMLAKLDGTGLVGLGIAAGPLRRIATDDVPLDVPGSLEGKVVAINDAAIARMTFEALGATTLLLPSGGGEVQDADAVEQQLASILGNRYHRVLPRFAVDLAFWPRPVILIANESRFSALSGEQQTGLREAADSFASGAGPAAEAEDAQAVEALCSDDAELVVAGAESRTAMLAAVESVYAGLAKDRTTAGMIHRIEEIKAGIPAPPVPSCPMASTSSGEPTVGFPDGTYIARITPEEMRASLEKHGLPADAGETCPCEHQLGLEDGIWTGGDGSRWTASFFGDRLTLEDPEGQINLRWRFDPGSEEVTFFDVEGGPDLQVYFTTKAFDRVP
jgi:TRAP-type C4-dicarboxylate transport system substrate-binding protein